MKADVDKTRLDQVFNLNESGDIFSFMKDYAYKNQALGTALIKRFLPDRIDIDSLREEVQDIFFSVDESGYKWGPSLNWHQIDEQLYRMMEKARYYDSEGEFDASASIASEIVLFVGEHYSEDCVYECERFDGYDFETRNAIEMLISLVESKVLDTNTVKRIRSDIKKAAATDTFRNGGYCLADLDEIQSVLDGVFDDFDKHIASLNERIDNAGRCVHYRNRWLLRKVLYLNYKEKYNTAEKVIDDNFNVPELSKLRIDSQVFNGQIEEAVASLDRAILCTEESSYVNDCHERRKELLESIGDDVRLADEIEYLLLNSYTSVYDNYLELKQVLERLPGNSQSRLNGAVVGIVKKKLVHNQTEIARICAEQRMIPQLAECLSWNNDYNNECYKALAEYGRLLDAETRQRIVMGHIDVIRMSAIPTNSQRYGYIVSHMEALRDSCEEGRIAVIGLIEEFKVKYSRRPSMMKELKKLC